ncbi:MAG: hypothetical protein J7K69_06300 [Thermotogae bacterium]|nr:hypothetical protein [Thermotogota bacterium]
MKKAKLVFILFVFLLTLSSVVFSDGILIYPIENKIPDNLFEHFGTKSKNIQILNLTGNESDKYVLIIKGWIFVGEGIGVEEHDESTLEIQTEQNIFTLKIQLHKRGFYMEFGPYLLILPKNFKNLQIDGFERISIGDL